jgi:hypothetical protein
VLSSGWMIISDVNIDVIIWLDDIISVIISVDGNIDKIVLQDDNIFLPSNVICTDDIIDVIV